jgi:hypothetical protein
MPSNEVLPDPFVPEPCPLPSGGTGEHPESYEIDSENACDHGLTLLNLMAYRSKHGVLMNTQAQCAKLYDTSDFVVHY